MSYKLSLTRDWREAVGDGGFMFGQNKGSITNWLRFCNGPYLFPCNYHLSDYQFSDW